MIHLPYLHLARTDDKVTVLAARVNLTPLEQKEVDRLNSALESAVQAALAAGNAACLAAIGETETGWSSELTPEGQETLRRILAGYLLSELTFRKDQRKAANLEPNEKRYFVAKTFLSVIAVLAVVTVATAVSMA